MGLSSTRTMNSDLEGMFLSTSPFSLRSRWSPSMSCRRLICSSFEMSANSSRKPCRLLWCQVWCGVRCSVVSGAVWFGAVLVSGLLLQSRYSGHTIVIQWSYNRHTVVMNETSINQFISTNLSYNGTVSAIFEFECLDTLKIRFKSISISY